MTILEIDAKDVQAGDILFRPGNLRETVESIEFDENEDHEEDHYIIYTQDDHKYYHHHGDNVTVER